MYLLEIIFLSWHLPLNPHLVIRGLWGPGMHKNYHFFEFGPWLPCNPQKCCLVSSWWRHQMETFSALLVLCAGNSPVPVNSPHKSQWRGALMFSLICARINDWVNKREAGDLRRHRGHYDVSVMIPECFCIQSASQKLIIFNLMTMLRRPPTGPPRPGFCSSPLWLRFKSTKHWKSWLVTLQQWINNDAYKS